MVSKDGDKDEQPPLPAALDTQGDAEVAYAVAAQDSTLTWDNARAKGLLHDTNTANDQDQDYGVAFALAEQDETLNYANARSKGLFGDTS